MPPKKTALITPAAIAQSIFLVRGHKVMLDSALAQLYQVETSNLNKAVQRNRDRFPADFMFQLTPEENTALRFQIGTSKGRGGRRYLPYVFTEQGVAMLSSVLRSKRAVQVNIEIVRTFVRLREILATHKDLARKLATLENKYDQQFKIVFDAIRKLMSEPPPKRRPIGFTADLDD
jgi:phage regulator Rha-like protein